MGFTKGGAKEGTTRFLPSEVPRKASLELSQIKAPGKAPLGFVPMEMPRKVTRGFSQWRCQGRHHMVFLKEGTSLIVTG